jgi:hypothetical protein
MVFHHWKLPGFHSENGAELSLDEARRVKENYLALLTKLEFQQKDGQLIEMTSRGGSFQRLSPTA